MTYRSEAGTLPGRHESVNPRPTVKGHAKRVGFKEAIHFVKCGLEPGGIVIVQTPAPVSGPVAHEIGRVGDDKVHGSVGHRAHDGNAVPLEHLVKESSDWFQRPPPFSSPPAE